MNAGQACARKVKAIMYRIFIGMLMWAAMASLAMAVDIVKPLKSEEFAIRYAYPFKLLEQVLKKTSAKYGAYVEQPYTEPVSVARQHQLAVEGKLINIMISDAGQKTLDEGMIPIPFPIDKGLLGYRVALIAKQNQEKISKINNMEQFRALIIGQGSNWGDVRIYEYNHVPIKTAQTYESLFLMLLHDRFDLFPRGVTEAPQEMAAYGPRHPDLAIEQHLLIKYPYAQFFYVSKSQPQLAKRLKDGLEQMAKDGSFDALFDKHFKKQLSELKLRQRVVIELKNPFLPAWVPFDRQELWFDPKKLR